MTKEKAAQKVGAQIRKYFGAAASDLFVRGNEVIWESGPFTWAFELPYATHVESVGPALQAAGKDAEYHGGWTYKVPTGFFAEPVNHYSVALWPL